MLVLYVTFGSLLSIGFWARPLVSNALMRDRADQAATRVRVQ
jgi:hypothetical protein